jgi:beta-carotene ketolase (CrtW type)
MSTISPLQRLPDPPADRAQQERSDARLRAPRGAALNRQAWLGLLIALGILAAWAGSLSWLLARPLDSLPWWAIAAGALLQTYLYTGLFITAHDAMHGLVFPIHRRINDAVGHLCCGLYAMFSFKALRRAHREHHGSPTEVGEDPDYHDGKSPGPVAWYFHFMRHYLRPYQIVGQAIVFNVLLHVLGVDHLSLVAFWVVPALLSTVQLFFFGTYLPHRQGEGHNDRHNARSNDLPPWLSMLTCYHFGYHWEHHAYPFVPWWRLPQARRAS